MKKLLPLLLFAVVTMFVACEDHEPTRVTAQFPETQEILTIESELVVKLQLNQPAEQNLTIPFELTGDAEEDFDYEFVGSNEQAFHIAQGGTEASFSLKHLERNGVGKDIFVKLKEGAGYAIGSNSICQIIVAPRAPIYLNFTSSEIPGREFSIVEVEVTASNENPDEPFAALEDLIIPLKGIWQYDEPNLTNIPDDSWSWASNLSNPLTYNYDGISYDTLIIPIGENKGSLKMRLTYANEDLPKQYDPEYQLGITFYQQRDLAQKGYLLGEIDTTYIKVSRIQDPIQEFLVGKKLGNPLLGFQQDFGNKELFDAIVKATGEDASLLPSQTVANDGLTFTKNPVTNTVNMSVTADSDAFKLYFRTTSGPSFTSYSLISTPYMLPAKNYYYLNESVGFGVRLLVNRRFLKDLSDQRYVEVLFIPAVVTQTDFDITPNYIDVIIPSGSYSRERDNDGKHFFYTMENFNGPVPIDNTTYPYVPSANFYDVWYRFELTSVE